MCEDEQDPHALRKRILTSLFEKIDEKDAVALVGILFEYRIVLSLAFWSLLRHHSRRIPLEPLEPQEACSFVARLFHMDCDALFTSFDKDWSQLRNSPRTAALKSRIESHELVARLEPWSALP
ncbi:MAG TPA: hypothetical protein VMY37_04150 [Thermoguttaceae bacterium]|nr:hypothetical protein [Thermoguttaceae bacterium]